MIVTRQCNTGRNTWSSSKLEAIYHNAASPRMSNFEPLSTQPDWREQYSPFPLPGENSLLQPSYEQSTGSDNNQAQPQSSVRSLPDHRHSLGPLRHQSQPATIIDRPDSCPGDAGSQVDNPIRDDSLVSTESTSLSLSSLGSNPLSSASSASAQHGNSAKSDGEDMNAELKEEEDEDDDEEEMLDVEEGSVPQTAAERRAERRKMKRFRLTHQQTRFLMSEFSKQAHPDAAHRERLSREIPGLSPRQVQVWFQNRRAKIKRLTADDRERMMKMRAVPDDFDNLQALHSSYGAVHSTATPMESPVDFVATYTEHMIRPLMVDPMRRNNNEEHMSPTTISPTFGQVGFASASSMGHADVLSPLSLNSTDRFFPSHLSSPMSAGPRTANMFDRQSSYQEVSHLRQQVRPLQRLQLRETISRSRSESLQSPLRTSMSWKGETLDYGSYQTGQSSTQLSGQQQSVYQPDQIGSNAVNAHQYDVNAYSNSNIQGSQPHITYSPTHGPSTSLQQSSPSTMSRIRASSSAFPPGLDLRNQYRTLPSQNNSTHGLPRTPRRSSFASAFSGGYSSAPLTPPVDFSLPRRALDNNQGARDFNIPQLSAPMAAPQDFLNAYNSSIIPVVGQRGERDFGNRGGKVDDPEDQQRQGQVGDRLQAGNKDEASYMRPTEWETGQKRKRSYTMPSTFESP